MEKERREKKRSKFVTSALPNLQKGKYYRMMHSLPAPYLRDTLVANGAKNGALGPAAFESLGLFFSLFLRGRFSDSGSHGGERNIHPFPTEPREGGRGDTGEFGR